MPNPMKQNRFLPSVPRVFTRPQQDAYSLVHFCSREEDFGEEAVTLDYPAQWHREAAKLLADEAAYTAKPTRLKTIEENTVPSWLWSHSTACNTVESENKTEQVFDRIVGAATYAGWKKNLFIDEVEARNFFDELRYALAVRSIAIDPPHLAGVGLDWAYGIKDAPQRTSTLSQAVPLVITNPMIDAIVSGSTNKDLRSQWQHILHAPYNVSAFLRFADTSNEWGHNSTQALPVMIDVLALRHNDGSINIDSLCHAIKLAVILVDLLDLSKTGNLALGLCNLAPLLMALTLPYDSEAARMTAASLTAIMTAQATIISAQLAALRGTSSDFSIEREAVLRRLRNHRRAAYGDQNDYEKISVLPQALSLTAGLDLTLVSAAQHLWDEALDLTRRHGQRYTHTTSFLSSSKLALFMESSTQGINALPSLTLTRSDDGETYTQVPHPCLNEAMTRLGYNNSQSTAIIAHATGHRSLDKSPTINHAALRVRGFDKAALDRIENYLPYVNTINLAFTPWILGADFCREKLKVSTKQIEKPAFDLLQYLGFTKADIDSANSYYYGHGSVRGAKDLHSEHASVFVCKKDVSPESYIRMASSVQSFLSDDVDVCLELLESISLQKAEALVLTAWRQGLKSLALSYDKKTSLMEKNEPTAVVRKPRRKLAPPLNNTQQSHIPNRGSKAKASRQMVGMGTSRGKSPGLSRSKTR